MVQESQQQEPSSLRNNHGKILVVDDEEAVRAVACAILHRAGFLSVQAVDGRDAVDKLQQLGAEIRLVLLDLMMPRLDGAEALAQLHSLRPEIPVIVMSGLCESDVTDRLTGARLAGRLQKPFRPNEMLELVHQTLPAAAPACECPA
jgi:two-component system cell cycle sensor histidine kinase/response regulator CckA